MGYLIIRYPFFLCLKVLVTVVLNLQQSQRRKKLLKKRKLLKRCNYARKKLGLYANIHAKRKRIKAGSGEKMRKKGAKGAPTDANFRRAAKTAKKR